jgi:hypothetical protein
VELTRCTLIGRQQGVTTGTGYPAVLAVASRLTISSSTITGGRGGSDFAFEFGNGGPALLASNSSVDLGPGAVLTGGEGGIDPSGLGCYTIMRPGGPALQLQDRAVARAIGATLTGGCSAGTCLACTTRAPHLAVDGTSSFTTPGGTAPALRLRGAQVPNSAVDVLLGAGPNEVALLAFGFTPAFVALPAIVDFGGILTLPEIVFGPFVTDAAGGASFRLLLPLDFVRDRPVWAQYFTFPALQLPGMGSNTATILVRS